MVCKGKTNINYSKGRGDKLHIVFDMKGRPIFSCRKDEVAELFDNQFWKFFDAWQYYHNGFGLPHGGSWGEYDPVFLNTIMQMEIHFKNNFSLDIVMVQYLETIIKRIDHYAKIFAKRGR